jgi:hypothetical protein
MLRTAIVLAGLALSAAASADSNTMTGRPGFFEPTPDGNTSLTRFGPLPPPADVAVIPEAAPPAPAVVTTPPMNPAASTRARDEALDKAEVQLDRAEREHEKLTERSQQTATTLQGAFNGLTGESNR